MPPVILRHLSRLFSLYVCVFLVLYFYNIGSLNPVTKVIEEYSIKFQARGIPLIHLQHDAIPSPKKNLRVSPVYGYEALAQHYGWAISEVFQGLDDTSLPIPDRVMILEEDIHTAPDFFSYMK